MSINKLYRTKCYLIGPIEKSPDSGVGWRRYIASKLESIGIIVYDPCNKPFEADNSLLDETPFFQDKVKALRSDGRYDELSKIIREVRIYDLRLVDLADFIIFNYDPDVQTCGSWEEFFVSNSSKKVIFFICDKGMDRVPTWVFGVIPHKFIYKSITEVVDMLKSINSGEKEIDSDRWKLLKKEFR